MICSYVIAKFVPSRPSPLFPGARGETDCASNFGRFSQEWDLNMLFLDIARFGISNRPP
jgi:hypothetical protein